MSFAVTGGRPLARIHAFRAIRSSNVQQRTADGEERAQRFWLQPTAYSLQPAR
jgi:hypothetical protein